jgi:hypothetical protein
MANRHVERPPSTATLPFGVWWAIGEALAAALILAALMLSGAL